MFGFSYLSDWGNPDLQTRVVDPDCI
jgi:hypothetical protein